MKTLTMRIEDSTYQAIKIAADGQNRNLSNFIEFATMQYLSSSEHISDGEMSEIMADEELVKNLQVGKQEAQNEEYTIV